MYIRHQAIIQRIQTACPNSLIKIVGLNTFTTDKHIKFTELYKTQ